jgi:hypothetical protein
MNNSHLESTTISTTTTTTFSTTTTRVATAQQRLLFTHKPWIYYSTTNSPSIPTTTIPSIKSTTPSPTLSSDVKTTLPVPTPWYSPAGPFDWWQWQWYTTKSKQAPITIHSTTQISTTTTTTSTTTTTVTTTTTKSTTRLSTKTSTISTSTKQAAATIDWFKWPTTEPSSINKKPLDDSDEEYKSWLAYLSTNKIQGIITSTVTISTLLSISPRQKYQQIGYFPTKSNWRIVTINTPANKRQHSQLNPAVSERNAVGIQTNGKSDLI